MNALRQRAEGLVFSSPTEGVIYWDGTRLTVDGEPHFAIYVNNRLALAASILRLTCADHTPITDAEVEAFATLILAPFQLDEPMTLHPEAGPRWLAAYRA